MFISSRLLLSLKLIFIEILGLVCQDEELFHSNYNSHSSTDLPFDMILSVSADDYVTVLNCSTPDHVPHHKLDWYFQTQFSSHPPRVIWQRGRSNTPRYLAYSPDQFRHFLQIKPLFPNDSGTYMCLDQTSGYSSRFELLVQEGRSCASTTRNFLTTTTTIVCLVALLSLIFRYAASETQVT